MNKIDFKVLFESTPDPYLVLDRNLIIIAVNDAYTQASMTERTAILGKGIFDVFPDNPDDPIAEGVNNLKVSLLKVIKTKKPDSMAVQKYDIRKRDDQGGGFEVRFWSPINTPVMDDGGNVVSIIHRVEDVTEFVRLKQQGVEHDKLTEALQEKALRMETEIFARTREVASASAELKRANDELKVLYEKTRELDELKTRFFANMSHEIRTPMNAILGLTHLLKHSNPTSEQLERLNKITNASTHLLSIINDILDFSKIEAGKLVLESSDFPISAILDHVRSLMMEVALDKNLTIEIDYDDSPIWLKGDQTRLRQALLNYISNAIKFTDKGGIVLRSILVEKKDDDVLMRFEVQDTGIGIAAGKIAELFHPFIQGDASTTRKYGGTGLGLAITQRLAALMGGEAGVDSKLGEGSTFWFTAWLKLGQPVLPIPIAESESTLRKHHAGMKVLLAEDDPINREVASSLLSDVGLNVEWVENGVQALAKIVTDTYDLVLMDIQMSVMDGIEATRQIRMMPEKADLPILAFTANVFEDYRERCVKAGMNDFVAKPVEPDLLYTTLLKWLPRRGKQTPLKSTQPQADSGYEHHDAVLLKLQAISGLDLELGLKRFGGKLKKYLPLFLEFAERHQHDISRIRVALDSGAVEDAMMLAHTLRGSAGTLGLITIQHNVAKLEKVLGQTNLLTRNY